jgi:hypothetical protein
VLAGCRVAATVPIGDRSSIAIAIAIANSIAVSNSIPIPDANSLAAADCQD